MPDAVRAGLIGASPFVRAFFVPGLLGRDDFTVTAVCSRGGTTAAAVAADLGGTARVYTDYRTMLDQEKLDAAIVVTPDGEHHPMVMAALEAGLHVLCDKPLSTTHQLAKEMCQAAAAAGRVHMVNFPMRAAPGVLQMRQMVRGGELGQVYHAHASWTGDYAPGDRSAWRYTRAGGGSGAMAEMGAHAIDLLQWILGDVQQVCADTGVAIPVRDLGSGGRAQTENGDVTHALMRLAGGIPATLRASRVDTTGWNRQVSIACAAGGVTLRVRDGNLQVVLRPPDGQPRLLENQPLGACWPQMARTQITRFCQAILAGARDGDPAFPSFRDGERVQAVIEAADASARQGGWVTVAPGERPPGEPPPGERAPA